MSQLNVNSMVSVSGAFPPASPSRVWFQAQRSYISSGNTPAVGRVPFATEVADSHNAFDLTNSVFVAPVAGLYLFTYNFAAAVTATAEGDLGMVRKNGVSALDGSVPTHKLVASGGWSNFQQVVLALCAVNDQIEVYCAQAAVAHNGMRYGFQGVLLG
jgi:hypothetical protein